MKPDFIDRTAKIIAEVRTRICIDKIDARFIEAILQDALEEGYDEGYDVGYSEGYDDGYEGGYDEGSAAGKSSLEVDVDSAYDEGS